MKWNEKISNLKIIIIFTINNSRKNIYIFIIFKFLRILQTQKLKN